VEAAKTAIKDRLVELIDEIIEKFRVVEKRRLGFLA
jgi:hypothetical protein